MDTSIAPGSPLGRMGVVGHLGDPAVDAVELGHQLAGKGLRVSGLGDPLYATDVDIGSATVTIGPRRDLYVDQSPLEAIDWVGTPVATEVAVQASAHGYVASATVHDDHLTWTEPHRRVASGQSVVFYDGDLVVGSATAA